MEKILNRAEDIALFFFVVFVSLLDKNPTIYSSNCSRGASWLILGKGYFRTLIGYSSIPEYNIDNSEPFEY